MQVGEGQGPPSPPPQVRSRQGWAGLGWARLGCRRQLMGALHGGRGLRHQASLRKRGVWEGSGSDSSLLLPPPPDLLTISLHLSVCVSAACPVCAAFSPQEPARLLPSLPHPSLPSLLPWASTATAQCPPAAHWAACLTLYIPTGFTPTQVGILCPPAHCSPQQPSPLPLTVGSQDPLPLQPPRHTAFSCSVTQGRGCSFPVLAREARRTEAWCEATCPGWHGQPRLKSR